MSNTTHDPSTCPHDICQAPTLLASLEIIGHRLQAAADPSSYSHENRGRAATYGQALEAARRAYRLAAAGNPAWADVLRAAIPTGIERNMVELAIARWAK